MKNMTTLLLWMCMPLLFAQSPQTSKQDEIIQSHDQDYYQAHSNPYIYTNKDGDSMPYRLHLPPNYDSQKEYPLVFVLHGAGSRGDDNLKQLRPWTAGWIDEDFQKQHPCIILMPQCPKKQQWVNVPWKKGSYALKEVPISKPVILAKGIFDQVRQEYAVDKKRIYVMGMSMGGYGTWNFLLRYHKYIAAAVPICGAGDPSMAKKIKNIPIWVFHGDQDPTVPLEGSTDMIDALGKFKNHQSHLTIYKGVGHNSYELAWQEAKLIDWLFKQKK